jgi:hypothetical protein
METITRQCTICGTPFQPLMQRLPGGSLRPTPRQTCSEECREQLRNRNRTANRKWSQVELERLTTLAGQHPFKSLVRLYSRWASANGYPRRTETAIRARLMNDHGTVVPEYDGWPTKTLARMLGINRTRIQLWTRHGDLVAPMVGKRRVIRIQALRDLAQSKPHLFAGCDPEGLGYALDDAEWAQRILAEHPVPRTVAKAVIRVEDGRRFRTIENAAHAVGRTAGNITRALQNGGTCAGYHWRLADCG